MRPVLYLCFLFFWSGMAFGSDTIFTHVFRADVDRSFRFGDSIDLLLDQKGDFTIEKLLNDPQKPAFSSLPEEIHPTPPFVVWSRIRFVNAGTTARRCYFRFFAYADSIRVYAVRDGKVVDRGLTGSALKPTEKSLRSSLNYYPFQVDAGEEKVFYFRTYFHKPVHPGTLSVLDVLPARSLVSFEIEKYARQFFYAGIMMLFCLVSLFMFGMFRERVFIYFALLMGCYGIYFLKMEGILDSLYTYRWRNDYVSIGQLTASAVLLSVFLFSSRYIRLPERMPAVYRFSLVFTIVTAVFAHVYRLLTLDGFLATRLHNFLLLLWLPLAIAPVVILAWKGDKSARILLVSVGILAIGSFLNLMQAQGFLPFNSWTANTDQIGTIFFSGVLFYGLFDKINTIRGEKKRIEELARLKSQFFANISHEFRTPLTLMLGPIRQLLEKSTDPAEKDLLSMAHRNANRQLLLVNQLLDLSKLDAGKMNLQASEEDFIPFLKGIAHAYESLAKQKNIALKVECPEGRLPLFFNRDKMEKILFNLLSNAFKFTPSGGSISIRLQKKKDKAAVTVADTGTGITADRLPNIFDRFFQAESGKNAVQEGSGIGLALVRELVQLHGGSVSVASEEGKGTSFYLQFPLGKAHLQPEEIAGAAPGPENEQVPANWLAALPADETMQEPEAATLKDAARLLVIEDNEDVRAFIRHRLQHSFQILEAFDGEDGVRKAFEHMPDLIISDVMMPRKDGYEVCQILKTDLRTSHIPIILLTAKAAQEEKLEGLETGADDYLTKPFDSRELEVRAQNLIRLRQQLRERFAKSISLKPSEVVTNSLDQEFLENAMRIVEANISNESFNIETMSREIGMSRPNLNRKLRALINQSTNQFIQSVRLQRAADLLRQKAGTVSEIAFRTGFSSTAYFVKCFKDQFGETPGNFLKQDG